MIYELVYNDNRTYLCANKLSDKEIVQLVEFFYQCTDYMDDALWLLPQVSHPFQLCDICLN